MKHLIFTLFAFLTPANTVVVLATNIPPSPVVDTGQVLCFDSYKPIRAPMEGTGFFGQDAQYCGFQPAYRDNLNGTVTDCNTGLTWSRACYPEKVTLKEALEMAENMRLAGQDDWRVPTIKELYSLIDFRGCTGTMTRRMDAVSPTAIPYINTDYFDFRYGNVEQGERFIDAQWLSCTVNVSPVMGEKSGLFGVNFADGRIKCYPMGSHPRGGEKRFYVRFVRGRSGYGENQFRENGDGTISDLATGLTWLKQDSETGMSWEEALSYAEAAEFAGYDDWRLPNAKELQSIVDYDRSPGATDSAAIDPVFECTDIKNEAGEADFPYYWTSTTHVDGPNARQAIYIAFGRAIGVMNGRIMDVHGAGAQRSDPKVGEPRLGHGPQGDSQRVYNRVRLVRGGLVDEGSMELASDEDAYPSIIKLPDSTYVPEPMEYVKMPHNSFVERRSFGDLPPPPLPTGHGG